MAIQVEDSVTIAASGTTSGVVSNRGATATGVILPATFTGTALTFSVSDSSTGTFSGLNNDSGAVSITVAQGKAYALPAALKTFPYFKIISGSTEGSARTITVFRQIEN